MRAIILMIFWGLSYTLYSQNCQYKKNEVDEFTDVRVMQTQPIVFVNFTEKLKCSLSRIGDEKYFIVELTTNKTLYSIEKEHPLYLIFSDGSKENLEPKELISFSRNVSGYDNINVAYSLKETLRGKEISKIRISSSDGFFDYEIKKKRAKSFLIDHWNCIE